MESRMRNSYSLYNIAFYESFNLVVFNYITKGYFILNSYYPTMMNKKSSFMLYSLRLINQVKRYTNRIDTVEFLRTKCLWVSLTISVFAHSYHQIRFSLCVGNGNL